MNVRYNLLRSAAALLLLTVTGCAGGAVDSGLQAVAPAPPLGFSADTFSREGLISGATASEVGCRALADGLWVGTGEGRHECLRYAIGGTERVPARTALVYISGDAAGVAYRFAGGRPQIDGASERYEVSAETRHAAAAALSEAMGGAPVILIGRLGMHGSSGDHARDRHTWAEVELMDAALTALRRRYGFQDFVLSGFSSGGVITANLLAQRTDIRCAVIASAPLDLAAFYRQPDGALSDQYAMRRGDFADPMRTVRTIRSDATIVVLGDRRDQKVPASTWDTWVASAQRAGLRVLAAETASSDPANPGSGNSYHQTSSGGLEVARACAIGEPAALAPRGQLLSGTGTKPAFASRLLRAVE